MDNFRLFEDGSRSFHRKFLVGLNTTEHPLSTNSIALPAWVLSKVLELLKAK